MERIKPNIIILGPQGSGKSTQSDILADKYGFQQISIGNIARKIIASKSTIGKEMKKYESAGNLIPDSIIIKDVLEPTLKKIAKKNGLVFDGIPRNEKQTKLFINTLTKCKIAIPYLIYLSIPPSVAKQRIADRRICSICGKIHSSSKKKLALAKCSKCGNVLDARSDDQDEKIIQKRLDIFYKNSKKIIDYFKKIKHYIYINGNPSIKKVNSEIISKINQL